MNIVSYFTEAAKEHPHTIAIDDGKAAVTYALLDQSVKRSATYLKSKGIGKGDRVLVFIPVSTALYRVVLALFYIGAVAVFIDEWAGPGRLRKCCEQARCKGFIAPWYLRAAALLFHELRTIPVWLTHVNKAEPTADTAEHTSDEELALVTFTTGSTGVPKGAARTHGFLKAQFNALKKYVPTQQVNLTTLPIVMLLNLGLGKTTIIPGRQVRNPKKYKAQALLAVLRNKKAGSITASPSYLLTLATYLQRHQQLKLPVEAFVTGGAALYPNEALLLKEVFAGVSFCILYGSTEAEPIAACNLDEYLAYYKPDPLFAGIFAGTPVPEVSLAIIPYTDAPVAATTTNLWKHYCLAPGQAGEICVSGKHVLKSYLFDEAAIARNKIQVDETTWHRTGDMGMLNNKGQVLLMGRCKWSYRYKDQMLYTYVLEQRLKFNGVQDAAFLVKSNPVIVICAGRDFNEVSYRGYLGHMLPTLADVEIRRVKAIPKDPRHGSKTDYDKLYDSLA